MEVSLFLFSIKLNIYAQVHNKVQLSGLDSKMVIIGRVKYNKMPCFKQKIDGLNIRPLLILSRLYNWPLFHLWWKMRKTNVDNLTVSPIHWQHTGFLLLLRLHRYRTLVWNIVMVMCFRCDIKRYLCDGHVVKRLDSLDLSCFLPV